MDLIQRAAALRQGLLDDLRGGLTALAESASQYANDRDLVFRAIVLRRELSQHDGVPTPVQLSAALQLLEDLIHDQSTTRADSRNTLAEAVRERALSMTIPNAVAVECRNLKKSYRRGSFVLDDVSIDVRYGEILGVVGRNGNGKTTLFRLLIGDLRPDGGEVAYPDIVETGRRIQWSKVRGRIAYVPQELPPWYGSLRSNLHFEAALHGIRPADNEREVEFIVERLGLADDLAKRWHELSGGFKLRFALARALVWKPKLLMLDEPLANLDFLTQQIVLNDLRHLADSLRYPLAILISSQHLHEIEAVSDKLLLLKNGKVGFFGPIGDVGRDRQVNSFEIDGDVDLNLLRRVFQGAEFHSVYHSGATFVLTTSIRITGDDVLRHILAARLPITYFRDISRSAKSLLRDDHDAA